MGDGDKLSAYRFESFDEMRFVPRFVQSPCVEFRFQINHAEIH